MFIIYAYGIYCWHCLPIFIWDALEKGHGTFWFFSVNSRPLGMGLSSLNPGDGPTGDAVGISFTTRRARPPAFVNTHVA